jgi:Asp-tRNA(Asn)/Glu-tRNA(Gln) amidotransferase A subunit family amidase
VIPLNVLADVAGPMTRTLKDAVVVFQAIVGEDPDDPATAASRGRTIPNYAASLVKDGLRSARIGVLRQAYERPSTDPEIVEIFMSAIADLKRAGASIVDPAIVGEVRRAAGGGSCRGFKYDINTYLAAHADRVPVHTLEDIIKSRAFHPSIQQRLQAAQEVNGEGPDSAACRADAEYRAAFGAAVTKTMDTLRLDALVYPTWSNPPRLIGDMTTPAGDNSQIYAPTSGFPALNVPMGYSRGNTLPIGITFFGRAWDEATLIRLAYAYEQATHHRRQPASAPAIK